MFLRKERSDRGKPTPEQTERHYRNCHQGFISRQKQPDVAAVIEEVQLSWRNFSPENRQNGHWTRLLREILAHNIDCMQGSASTPLYFTQ
jgi:hypothetical protein